MGTKSHKNGSGVLNECKVDCGCEEPRDLATGEFYGAVSGKTEVPGFLLSEIHHARERRLPTHSHRSAYFSLLMDGSYAETYGGRDYEYRPMTVWWHRPGIVHHDAIGAKGGRFFNVELSCLPPTLDDDGCLSREDFAEHGTRLVWLACRLFREVRTWQPCSHLAAEGFALEMTAALARRPPRDARGAPWLARVIEKLNDEPALRHSMTELAALAGVHRVHLAAVFRKAFDQTVGEYVRGIRVRRAADLLRDSDVELADIASALGFADQSHFTRGFRSVVGLSPGLFRQTFAAQEGRRPRD